MKNVKKLSGLFILKVILILMLCLPIKATAQGVSQSSLLTVLYPGPFVFRPDAGTDTATARIPIQIAENLTPDHITIIPIAVLHGDNVATDLASSLNISLVPLPTGRVVQMKIESTLDSLPSVKRQGDYKITLRALVPNNEHVDIDVTLHYPETKLITPKNIFIERIRRISPPWRVSTIALPMNLRVEEGPALDEVIIESEMSGDQPVLGGIIANSAVAVTSGRITLFFSTFLVIYLSVSLLATCLFTRPACHLSRSLSRFVMNGPTAG